MGVRTSSRRADAVPERTRRFLAFIPVAHSTMSSTISSTPGFSTYDALATATVLPGRFISQSVRGATRFGTIEVGARADLVLVDRNPLDDLSVLRVPRGVMAAGRWFDRAELDRLVPR